MWTMRAAVEKVIAAMTPVVIPKGSALGPISNGQARPHRVSVSGHIGTTAVAIGGAEPCHIRDLAIGTAWSTTRNDRAMSMSIR